MTEKLIIQKTKNTPAVVLDKEKNIFKFEGRALPNNPMEFFRPIINWLKEYAQKPNPKTIIDINITYFNSSSALFFAQIFDIFQYIYNNGYDILINWYYEEDDAEIMENGEEMSEIFNLPVRLLPVEVK